MLKKYIKIVSVILIVALFVTTFLSADITAATKTEIQNEISKLEQESKKLESEIKQLQGKINEQKKLKDTIEDKMAVVIDTLNDVVTHSELSEMMKN